MLREFEADGNTGVGAGGGVVAGCKYMGGTRGSDAVYSAIDVMEMSVVTGVSGVCEMCMCLARFVCGRCWVSGSGDRGWALPIMLKQRECLCLGCSGVGGIGG